MSGLRISELSPLKLAVAAKQLTAQLEILNAEPIAVIGMACRFPGNSDNCETYWHFLKNGRDGIVEMPADRWNIRNYYDADPDKPGKMYCRSGGFLKDVDKFDARFFGISRREAESLDPQQRLLLEVAWEALENANQPQRQIFGKSVGVYIGISTFDYASRRMSLKSPESIDAYYVSGTVLSVAAGRLSYILGLTGPSMSVDTACSSSLVSVHLGCQSLRHRECSMVIAGGVGLILAPEPSINFCKARMLSPEGRCKTFDASADGYARGEGCGVIVLKRLSDAIADNDTIFAMIRGSAVNQDGPSGGLTIPNGPSQEQVIRQALTIAGIEPNAVSYIEAHGTGTTLGDPIEVNSLGNVFFKQPRPSPLWLGSVKSNFGHLEAAAGIAGIIKVILSLQHRQIPPHIHFKNPNPHISWDKFNMKIPTNLMEWSGINNKRIAGVSSFGFAGTNAHVVLEEFLPISNRLDQQRTLENSQLFLISAKTSDALKNLAQRYVNHFANYPETNLADVCFTACHCRSYFPHRLAVIAESKESLSQKLNDFINDTSTQNIFTAVSEEDEINISDMFPLLPQNAQKIWGEYLDKNNLYQKAILPAYPFQRETYWIDTAVSVSTETGMEKFPGQKIHIPFSKEIHFETEFGLGKPSYIEDHRLFGTIVIAGASHIAMLLNAAKEVFNTNACILKDLLFQSPVVLKDDEIKTLHLALKPIETEYNVQLLSSSDPKENNWQIHLTGNIGKGSYHDRIELPLIENWNEEPASALYSQIREMGHHLGDSFRRIVKIFTKDTQAICQIQSPDISNLSEYQLYPGIIDSCFQFFCIRGHSLIVPALQRDNDLKYSKEAIYVPFSVEKIQFFNPPDQNRMLLCHVVSAPKDSHEINSLKSDMFVVDETGQPIAEITGFIARRLNRKELLKAIQDWSTPNLLYEITWQIKERGKSRIQRNSPSNWLILSNHPETEKKLSDELKSRNHNCTVRYKNLPLPEHGNESTKKNISAYDDIVYLPSFDEEQKICEPVMGLLGDIFLNNPSNIPRLWLITNSSQPIADQKVSMFSVWQSMLWGLGRVIDLEHPDLPCIRIDSDDFNMQLLADELLEWDGENQIAWRNGVRYAPRLTHFKEKNSNSEFQIQSDSTYLITGGTGALGLRLAQWLSEQQPCHIVLSARKMLLEQIKEIISQIEKNGTKITVIQADVSNQNDTERLFKEIHDSLPLLKGIFHLAGILDDASLLTLVQDMDRFYRVLSPKVQGAWNLHTLSADIPLDFFVCFSSAASVIGSAGQGNYAAANAFMDALAHYRRSIGLCALSINWGAWAEIGMAANMGKRERERLSEQGIGTIPPETGLNILGYLLKQDVTQAAVLPIQWSKYQPYGKTKPLFFSEVDIESKFEKNTQSSNIIRQLAELSPEKRRSILENYIQKKVASILKASSLEEIEIRQGLFDMGFDSLMAVELKNKLESELGQPLRSTLVFNYPTVEAITDYLMKDVLKFEDHHEIVTESTEQASSTQLGAPAEIEADIIGSKLDEKLAEIEKWMK